MKAIAACIVLGLILAAIALLFTGHILWLIPIGILLSGSLESLFIWLFIDPEFGSRQHHRPIRGVKAARDQNSPSI
jgi:Na+-translocating ferredoxin:NAD+ oxidoreductase RnfD subunit